MGDTTTTPETSNTAKAVTYDVNHPYHLNNSDSPGMTLVNTVFDGRGYPGWRRSILLSLSAKRKLGFINGVCKSPGLNSPELEQWNCVNDMVISWILNALSKDMADSVIYSKTAKELWDSLEQRFGKSNGAKLYHLQKELSGLVQGNSDIAGYFTKLKRLWDELDALNVIICCSCVCVCEGKAKLTKSLEDQRLIQFLMGLNDIYAQARGNILMMNPLPSMDVAYSLLLLDENQREVYANAHFNSQSVSFMAAGENKEPNAQLLADFAAFMITGQGKNHQKFRNQTQSRAGTGPKFNNSGQKFIKPQQKFKAKKKYNPNVSCTYCGKTGHTQEDCYRIIGFPDDFEFTNHKGYQNQIKGNAVVANEEHESPAGQGNELNGNNFGQQLSKEQVVEMMHIYKQTKMAQAGNTGINANTIAEFKYNLLSVHRFCVQFKYDVLFTSVECVLQGLSMKSPQAFGEVREGLYLLEPSSIKSKGLFSNDVFSIPKGRNSISESVSFPSPVLVNTVSDVNLWHLRPGYLRENRGPEREKNKVGQSLTVAPSLLLTPFLCECSALLFVALLLLATSFGFSLRHRVE
ncbi:PREDICTED: uncharacterized protein LOC109219732 [Nicotiana attenuata]|uniref:uncharacterized protein LOC109219732 n=1 Tax=Nicotiana attenuata TaxID=49451 RepID=UPI000905A663|nr:PREDICTED: uncharacterized protein LOC109219732 [Nicotiana attenuata]